MQFMNMYKLNLHLCIDNLVVKLSWFIFFAFNIQGGHLPFLFLQIEKHSSTQMGF